MGLFGDDKPDEKAVQEAIRRIEKAKRAERDEKYRNIVMGATGGMGCWLFMHFAVGFTVLTMVSSVMPAATGLPGLPSFAVGIAATVLWWRWDFRRAHPVLVVPLTVFGLVFGLFFLAQAFGRGGK